MSAIADFPGSLKETSFGQEEAGRRFSVSVSVFDTESRLFRMMLGKIGIRGRTDLFDDNACFSTFRTEAGKRKTYTLRFSARGNACDTELQKNNLHLFSTASTEEMPHPFYIDEVTVSEEITEPEITGVAPVSR